MTPVRLEPEAPRSPVKHSTTEPLRSLIECEGKGRKVSRAIRLVSAFSPLEIFKYAYQSLSSIRRYKSHVPEPCNKNG